MLGSVAPAPTGPQSCLHIRLWSGRYGRSPSVHARAVDLAIGMLVGSHLRIVGGADTWLVRIGQAWEHRIGIDHPLYAVVHVDSCQFAYQLIDVHDVDHRVGQASRRNYARTGDDCRNPDPSLVGCRFCATESKGGLTRLPRLPLSVTLLLAEPAPPPAHPARIRNKTRLVRVAHLDQRRPSTLMTSYRKEFALIALM